MACYDSNELGRVWLAGGSLNPLQACVRKGGPDRCPRRWDKSVQTQLPFVNFRPGGSVDNLLDPFSGRQEGPEGTPPRRGFRCTRLLGFVALPEDMRSCAHALAPAELERCAVFSSVLRARLSPIALRGSPRGPWTWQRQARIKMTRPNATTAEAPRGAARRHGATRRPSRIFVSQQS
jgi:hypothetical protein